MTYRRGDESDIGDAPANWSGLSGVGQVLERLGVEQEIAPLTESPIETIFGGAAVRFFRSKYRHHNTRFVVCPPLHENTFKGDHILLMPQYWWRSFRVDWAFKVTFLKQPYYFVECDGREFHSTGEQILRDRERDQIMKDAGIPVFRFTGREIVANASACAAMVWGEMKEQDRKETA